MKAHPHDSVLIEQVVLLASKARVATGQDPIFDIPKGYSSADKCPIARALNLGCSVNSVGIVFEDNATAVKVARAVGLPEPTDTLIRLPNSHPFSQFVTRYDHGTTKPMRQLRVKRR